MYVCMYLCPIALYVRPSLANFSDDYCVACIYMYVCMYVIYVCIYVYIMYVSKPYRPICPSQPCKF